MHYRVIYFYLCSNKQIKKDIFSSKIKRSNIEGDILSLFNNYVYRSFTPNNFKIYLF